MAHSRGRGSTRTFNSRERRRTGWEEGPFTSILTLTGAGSSAWSTGQQPTSDGNTIGRIRGQFTLALTAGSSALDGFQKAAIGIGIVTAQAFATGISAMPTPLTDIEWEGWMFHKLETNLYVPAATEDFSSGPATVRVVDIDTKAMRKIGADEVLFGAVELGTEVGAATATFVAHTRMLVLLA